MLENIDLLLFAYFGGIAINVIQLAELAQVPKSQRPDTFKDPYYSYNVILNVAKDLHRSKTRSLHTRGSVGTEILRFSQNDMTL